MTITFQLPHDAQAPSGRDHSLLERACPSCGERPHHMGGNAPVECGTCMGYGGDPEAEAIFWDAADREDRENGSFQVTNDNARLILQDILGLGPSEAAGWGSIPVWQAELRLSLFINPEAAVRETVEVKGVVVDENGVGERLVELNFGCPAWRVADYVSGLNNLIRLAHERGASEIVWF